MRYLLLSLFCSLLLGCGGDLSQSLAPPTPPVPANAELRVSVDPAGVPRNAARFVVQVVDPSTGEALASALLDRTDLETTFPGLAVGAPFELQVTAQDKFGANLGVYSRAFSMVAEGLAVDVASLYVPGPTREIGRISIGQENSNGNSSEPALSADGRFVTFSSTATNLGTASFGSPRGRLVWQKDRLTGTLRPVSTVSLQAIGDGTSNTIFVGEVSDGGDSDPACSGDGRFVAFVQTSTTGIMGLPQIKVHSNLGQLLDSPTPRVIRLAGRDFEVTGGTDPCLSANGNILAFRATVAGQPDQIVVVRRNDNVAVFASAMGNQLSATACEDPTLTSNGRFVFFNDGLNGFRFDRNTGTLLTIPNGATQNAIAASDNGNLIAFNARGAVLEVRNLLNGNVLFTTPTKTIQGAPSISADGRFVTFASPRQLVLNDDDESVTDVFVLDRTTGVFSRVNQANDNFAVQGGVTLSPVISKDGTRIAFSSTDPRLVPNDVNGREDVFTAVNPTPGKLYLSTAGAVVRFDNIITANTPATNQFLPEAARITSPSLGPATAELFLDTANDRLYVATGPGATPDRVVMFSNASTLNGAVTPDLELVFPAVQGRGMAVDVTRDLLYLGNRMLSGLTNGAEPEVGLSVIPTALTLSTREAIMVMTTSNGLILLRSSLKDESLEKLDTGLAVSTRGLVLDPRSANGQAPNVNPFFIVGSVDGNRQPGAVPPSTFNRIFSVASGEVPKLIEGANTRLAVPNAVRGASPIALDLFTGQLYVCDFARVLVFDVRATGDVAPLRLLRPGFAPKGIALDRTR